MKLGIRDCTKPHFSHFSGMRKLSGFSKTRVNKVDIEDIGNWSQLQNIMIGWLSGHRGYRQLVSITEYYDWVGCRDIEDIGNWSQSRERRDLSTFYPHIYPLKIMTRWAVGYR